MGDGRAWWERAQPSASTATRTITAMGSTATAPLLALQHCAPFTLPSLGMLELSPGNTMTLKSNAIFTPRCPMTEHAQLNVGGGVATTADMRDPFHASITPQAYATGAATVIAWMLVIMLIITPRTFFVGGPSGRSGLMGRRGMIGGASGGASITGVGSRPWLQKVAALTVAISLSLATADTYRIAERQYNAGFMDAMQLRNEVVSGMEIKVSRVISDVFLWLAQVQTLIRLFPRHKEKVIIKWVGFALILLDITFTCLNSFGPYSDKRNPRHFETAIPALSYLFQLSLSMLYAAWVMYYAVTKRRYAFYHSMMWNMSLVALLSMVAILTPVVFFITDISNYTIAGWGDYFRWVGAAAASVVVWEWVERIEALEREERKDGILGREIYDGDEMLDTTPSQEVSWPGANKHTKMSDRSNKPGNGGGGGGGGGHGGVFASGHLGRLNNLAHRLNRTNQEPTTDAQRIKRRTIHIPAQPAAARRQESGQRSNRNSRSYIPISTPPPVIASPVSRTDTTSADSTVYTVRYHPLSDTPPAFGQPVAIQERLHDAPAIKEDVSRSAATLSSGLDPEKGEVPLENTRNRNPSSRTRWNWQAVASANPFRRKGRTPPAEVQRGRVIEPLSVEDVTVVIPQRNYNGFALAHRLGTFAAQQGDRFRKNSTTEQGEQTLPVTIIPAQPRGRTWSPEILLQQQSQQPEQPIHSEVPIGAGISITPDPPRTVPTIPEDDEPRYSHGGADSSTHLGEEADPTPAISYSRPLSPEAAQSAYTPHHPPPETETMPTLRPGTLTSSPPTPTNHDR